MSTNLCFDVKGGGMVDFPFQTTTELTYAVLKEQDHDKRLALIRKELEKNKYNKKEIKDTLTEIEALMKNPNLELSLI
jgi:hypothetical protein